MDWDGPYPTFLQKLYASGVWLIPTATKVLTPISRNGSAFSRVSTINLPKPFLLSLKGIRIFFILTIGGICNLLSKEHPLALTSTNKANVSEVLEVDVCKRKEK